MHFKIRGQHPKVSVDSWEKKPKKSWNPGQKQIQEIQEKREGRETLEFPYETATSSVQFLNEGVSYCTATVYR